MILSGTTMTLLGALGAVVTFLLSSEQLNAYPLFKLCLGACNAGLVFFLGQTNQGSRVSTSDVKHFIIATVGISALAFGVHGCALPQKAALEPVGVALCRYAVPEEQWPQIRQWLDTHDVENVESAWRMALSRLEIVQQASPALYGQIWNLVHAVMDRSGVTDKAVWQGRAATVIQQIVDGCINDIKRAAVA